ncbi:MAG: glycosyltransferase family 2 protein [Terrimicrobiaceae bacterium]
MTPPRVTVAVLSWNRLHYLQATLESARCCLRHPDLEWIVSDNESVEPGLRDYVSSLDWVEHKWFKTQTHAEAMNEIVARATGKYLLLWPEDVQFVVEGNWLTSLIETLNETPWIGSVGLNFLRRKTNLRLHGPLRVSDTLPILGELRRRPLGFRFPQSLPALKTFGWRLPGVIGSGIPSLTRLDCWKTLGPWRTRAGTNLIDSSLGAEDDMIQRFQSSGQNWQQAALMKPVAADIINDELGCKAKVRGGKRYGRYTPPQGDFYYEILPEEKLPVGENGLPLSFEKWIRPIGFRLPLDAGGDMLKASMNTSVVSEILPATT